MASIKGLNSGTNRQKMMCYNPNVDLFNMNAYIKFGEILSIRIQEYLAETKFWRQSRAITPVQMCEK